MLNKIFLILILLSSSFLNAIYILNCTTRVASFTYNINRGLDPVKINPGEKFDLYLVNNENINFTFAGRKDLTVSLKDVNPSVDIVLTEIYGRICVKFLNRDGTETEPGVEYNKVEQNPTTSNKKITGKDIALGLLDATILTLNLCSLWIKIKRI